MKSTKSKGREMQTQDDTEMCYQRENRRTLRKTSQGYQKDPSNLIYPMYLNPLSSSSHRTSPS